MTRMPISKEEYYSEYEITYKPLDVKGRRVVDIGGDYYGSSVDWFLDHGAAYVQAFESDPEIFKAMADKFRGNPKVVVEGAWNGEEIPGDILKIDCESCETQLTVRYLGTFRQFAVALHPEWMPNEKYQELKKYLEAVGAKMVLDLVKEQMYIKLS